MKVTITNKSEYIRNIPIPYNQGIDIKPGNTITIQQHPSTFKFFEGLRSIGYAVEIEYSKEDQELLNNPVSNKKFGKNKKIPNRLVQPNVPKIKSNPVFSIENNKSTIVENILNSDSTNNTLVNVLNNDISIPDIKKDSTTNNALTNNTLPKSNPVVFVSNDNVSSESTNTKPQSVVNDVATKVVSNEEKNVKENVSNTIPQQTEEKPITTDIKNDIELPLAVPTTTVIENKDNPTNDNSSDLVNEEIPNAGLSSVVSDDAVKPTTVRSRQDIIEDCRKLTAEQLRSICEKLEIRTSSYNPNTLANKIDNSSAEDSKIEEAYQSVLSISHD